MEAVCTPNSILLERTRVKRRNIGLVCRSNNTMISTLSLFPFSHGFSSGDKTPMFFEQGQFIILAFQRFDRCLTTDQWRDKDICKCFSLFRKDTRLCNTFISPLFLSFLIVEWELQRISLMKSSPTGSIRSLRLRTMIHSGRREVQMFCSTNEEVGQPIFCGFEFLRTQMNWLANRTSVQQRSNNCKTKLGIGDENGKARLHTSFRVSVESNGVCWQKTKPVVTRTVTRELFFMMMENSRFALLRRLSKTNLITERDFRWTRCDQGD